MPRILMTGAAGGIGTSLRKLLPPTYPDLVLSDLAAPADLGKNETFKAADLADLAQVEAICAGVDGILHFGGYSVEGPWEPILQANIIGGYNLFEAARKQGVKRVIFASSNHAVGFYPRHHRIGTDVTPRPVLPFDPAHVSLEARLKGLCKAACFPVLALAKDMGLPAPDIDQDEAIGRADAIALIDEVFGHMFPGLHAG